MEIGLGTEELLEVECNIFNSYKNIYLDYNPDIVRNVRIGLQFMASSH